MVWVLFPGRFVYSSKPELSKRAFFPSISVIICARNEAENLKLNLPYILEQSYSGHMEVVVVDDASSDTSLQELEVLSKIYSNLKIARIEEKRHPGKKEALAFGVSNAKYGWIVVTDADCRPSSKEWLIGLFSVAERDGIILGYAPLFYEENWFNKWTRYETLITALQYFSLLNTGWATMGVGRNMAWHRSAFDRLTKSQLNWDIPGGDDDLLVNQNHGYLPVFGTINPKTFVYSRSKARLTDWLRQKRRHLSAGTSYRFFHRLLLGGQAFTHSGHYGFGILILVFQPKYSIIVGLIYFVRLFVVYVVIGKACNRLMEKGLIPWTIIMDGLMAIWVGFMAPVLLILGPKRTW